MPPRKQPPPIARRIRQLREQAGLTVSQAATAAGLGRTAWYNLESGQRTPAWETLAAIAAALGASLGDFDLTKKETR
jgi:transcriptional regulator with XRE-family HTH domain